MPDDRSPPIRARSGRRLSLAAHDVAHRVGVARKRCQAAFRRGGRTATSQRYVFSSLARSRCIASTAAFRVRISAVAACHSTVLSTRRSHVAAHCRCRQPSPKAPCLPGIRQATRCLGNDLNVPLDGLAEHRLFIQVAALAPLQIALDQSDRFGDILKRGPRRTGAWHQKISIRSSSILLRSQARSVEQKATFTGRPKRSPS